MAGESRRRFEAEVRRNSAIFAQAFADATGDQAAAISLSRLVALIERIQAGGKLTEREWADLYENGRHLAPLDTALATIFEAGGIYQITALPKRPPGVGRLVIRFNGRHERAEKWIKNASSELIVEISDDQRENIQRALYEGRKQGHHPRRTALEIVGRIDRRTGRRKGGIISLTNQEAGWVQNLREELTDPAAAKHYFTRKARDRRFDRSVAKYIEAGQPVPDVEIKRIAERYADRLLLKRGQRIARTETIAAMNAGRAEAMAQLVDTGKVRQEHITKVWRSVGDAHTRDAHAEMNGDVVRSSEAFDSPTGAQMMHPGDRSLGAEGKDVIHCRCYLQYRVDWLAMAV